MLRARTWMYMHESLWSLAMTDQRTNRNQLYRVTEAAEVLGVGRTSLYALMKSGALRSVHVGRSRRIRSVDLDEFINALH